MRCVRLDARIPISSRNPDVDELTAGKPRLVVLNRVDQADPEATKRWAAYFRAKGYASMVTYEAVKCSKSQGMPVNTLCPAEPSLFGYYKNHVGYDTFFYTCQKEIKKDALISGEGYTAFAGEKDEYTQIREKLLADRTHIECSETAIGYQSFLCKMSGGDLLLIETPFGPGCATAEYADEKTLMVKELILPEGASEEKAAGAIAKVLEADEYILRYPAKKENLPDDNCRPFAMVFPNEEVNEQEDAELLPRYGFAFD